MRAVIQRVKTASVNIENNTIASIGEGILAFVGFYHEDTLDDLEYIANKILQLRIFCDDKDLMNLSLLDIEGELLIVSQFTLYGDARKGRRPSYSTAMPPNKAQIYFKDFIEICELKYKKVKSGIFQADMKINLVNSGPVTILLDSSKIF